MTTVDEGEASLILADDLPFRVRSESDLHDALKTLSHLKRGQAATLARASKRYIKAVRHGEHWAVTTRNGSYFTLASFTAALTTDYSERTVREDRVAGSMWKRIRRAILSPSPERSLSTAQVRTLFTEFFLRKRFSIPQSGA